MWQVLLAETSNSRMNPTCLKRSELTLCQKSSSRLIMAGLLKSSSGILSLEKGWMWTARRSVGNALCDLWETLQSSWECLKAVDVTGFGRGCAIRLSCLRESRHLKWPTNSTWSNTWSHGVNLCPDVLRRRKEQSTSSHIFHFVIGVNFVLHVSQRATARRWSVKNLLAGGRFQAFKWTFATESPIHRRQQHVLW